MVLSKRLMMSIGMIPAGKVVADVGCDHARVAIWLVKNKIAPRVIATDLRPGPLSHADANIAYFHCEDRIETRLSDGLCELRPSEAEVILIAGMGGGLTVHILSEGLDRALTATDLILQPQSERGAVRRFLYENGFCIVEEACCIEDGKFYNSIHAVPRKAVPRKAAGTDAVKPGECRSDAAEGVFSPYSDAVKPGGCQGDVADAVAYSDAEYEYGRYLLREQNPILLEYLRHEYQKAVCVKETLEQSNTQNAGERLPEFLQEMKLMEEALLGYKSVGEEVPSANIKMHGEGAEMRINMDIVTVTVKQESKVYPKGTTLFEISRDFAKDYASDIILASRDGKLVELNKKVHENCTVDFLTVSDSDGYRTYRRGMILLMLKAFELVLGKETDYTISAEHSIRGALYCEVNPAALLTEQVLESVKAKMRSLVAEDVPFTKKSLGTPEVCALFSKAGMDDKVRLLKVRRSSRTNVYNFDGYSDYYYGYMPQSSGILKYFDLRLYEEGFLLQVPKRSKPGEIPAFVPHPKLFSTLNKSNQWGKMMGIATVADLNDEIIKGNINDIMLIQEALLEKRIGEIAEQIVASGNKKFVMIAGPSSSGKTTFSHRLSIQLRTLGLKPHPIAVDDYFVNREDTPKDADGNYNYETIDAIDVEQFNKDMNRLLQGERVELPTFNFKVGKREYKGNIKQLGPDDVLVIEGIHCLNDKLSYTLPAESKFKIYISALSQLNIDNHNRIPTTDGRLLRRMVRDARTRGTGARSTIAMWPSVRRGEEENIFPYQESADVMFNSAMIYELPVIKQYAEPLLFGIPEDCPEYTEAKRLLKFLDYFLGVSSENVPKNSLLREFVGGSYFDV